MKALAMPAPIQEALEAGAALAVSVSGGKDSHAMLAALVQEHRARGWTGELYAVHSDLGRVEWGHFDPDSEFNTMRNVRRQCEELGVRLEVVARPQGDLIDRWRQRMEKLEGSGKPFWSSATNRYCTSDMKRDQIDKELRRHEHVVCAMGIRAEESDNRAAKAQCGVRSTITTKRLKKAAAGKAMKLWEESGRLAFDWLPIHHWSEDDVWQAIGHSLEDLERRQALWTLGVHESALDGWAGHPAYVAGNDRLSCALCVLASESDLVRGARFNPETWELMYEMEQESGFTFRQDLSLAEIGKKAGLMETKHREDPSGEVHAHRVAQLELIREVV